MKRGFLICLWNSLMWCTNWSYAIRDNFTLDSTYENEITLDIKYKNVTLVLEKWYDFLDEHGIPPRNNYSKINPIYGEDLLPKVINGRNAVEGEYPWMVALHYRGRFICSSFLISPTLVMTAAHCVASRNQVSPASLFYGVIGSVRRSEQGTIVSFNELHSHRGYGRGTENDIAVFRTTERVELSERVRTICLPRSGRRFEFLQANGMGWGVTQRQNGGAAEILQTAVLPVPPIILCQFIYGRLGSVITWKHVCAGGLDSGICYGDSGGPLVYDDNGTPVALGVASFGSALGCAIPFIPAVYTATDSYIDWLTNAVSDTSEICIK